MSVQSKNTPSTHWFPTASLEVLEVRSNMLRSVRNFFYDRGFCEVQTPALSRDTVVDHHLDPIEVPAKDILNGAARDEFARTYYLQTSPEFAMKRLMAAGMRAIFQIGPVFRAAERGQWHNPEFTMIEWYRTGDGLLQSAQLLSDLVQDATGAPAAELTTYQAAFQVHAGCDPLTTTAAGLAEQGASRLNVPLTWSEDKDDWLNLLFSELVQPQLGHTRPTIVTHYPASQSALARLSENSPLTAERFELFIQGVELANGYHELTDASELEKRNRLVNLQREADGKRPLPVESALLDAMRSGLPNCSGCALGLERLLMVHLGLDSIDQVMPFTIERS